MTLAHHILDDARRAARDGVVQHDLGPYDTWHATLPDGTRVILVGKHHPEMTPDASLRKLAHRIMQHVDKLAEPGADTARIQEDITLLRKASCDLLQGFYPSLHAHEVEYRVDAVIAKLRGPA